MLPTILNLLVVSQLQFVQIGEAEQAVKKLQPSLSQFEVSQIAFAVVVNADKANLSWQNFISILFQESSLKLDPTNCKENGATCTGDYGIGQVNLKTWGDYLDIDKQRMMTDYFYSIQKSAEIFSRYYELYGEKDANWWGRYHSKTPSLKRAYQAKVMKVHDRIVKRDVEVSLNGPVQESFRKYCIFR